MFENYYFIILLIILLIILAVIINFLNKSNIGIFQKIVLMIAIVVLLITLVIIAYALQKPKKNNWPPMLPNCPDYWTTDGSGNNMTCINVKDLGICKAQQGNAHLTMNFNGSPFNGANGNCAKYTWANNCKVAWDGLTYGGNNPCAN